MRPPVEHYARCTVTCGDVVIEPGLELRDGDDFDTLVAELRTIAHWIGGQAAQPRLDVCRAAAAQFDRQWPGRAFFVELHDAHNERWTQTFQPYGVPQNQSVPATSNIAACPCCCDTGSRADGTTCACIAGSRAVLQQRSFE